MAGRHVRRNAHLRALHRDVVWRRLLPALTAAASMFGTVIPPLDERGDLAAQYRQLCIEAVRGT